MAVSRTQQQIITAGASSTPAHATLLGYLANSILLTMAVIGAFVFAPLLLHLWGGDVPPASTDNSTGMAAYGLTRWAAVGSVLFVWDLLGKRPECDAQPLWKQIILWAAGSLLLFQLCLLTIVLFFPRVIAPVPTRAPSATGEPLLDQNRLIVLPADVLVADIGKAVTFDGHGNMTLSPAGGSVHAADPATPRMALRWHIVMGLVTWPMACLLASQLTLWIGRRMRWKTLFHDPMLAVQLRRGWCALLLLPYSAFIAHDLQAVGPYAAFDALRHVALSLLILAGTLAVTTPLMVLLVRGIGDALGSTRRFVGLVAVCIAMMLILAGRSIAVRQAHAVPTHCAARLNVIIRPIQPSPALGEGWS